jgi:hypothetical protein
MQVRVYIKVTIRDEEIQQASHSGFSILQQGRKCRHKAKIRRFRITILAVEKLGVLRFLCVRACLHARECVWSLIYSACKAQAPYYTVMYSLPGSTIFFDILS